MNSQTRDILASAYRENRLAAIHIDLQYEFYDSRVFPTVGKFAATLRKFGVPNIWVGYSWIKNSGSTESNVMMTVEKFNTTCCSSRHEFCDDIGALPEDAAMMKSQYSAFSSGNMALHDHLRETGKDTLLIDGVSAKACVAKTIIDGVLSTQFKYALLAVTDAIDINHGPENYESYLRMQWPSEGRFNNRFHTVQTQDCNFSSLAL